MSQPISPSNTVTSGAPHQDVGREPLRPTALEVRGLVKTYPGARRPAVNRLHLTIAEGEALGLLGPNGAGKTTAISVMCTLLPPTAGEVFIGGCDITQNQKEIRRQIGLIPQEIALYPRLTLRENLRYFGRLHGIRGLDLEERVAEALELVRLEEFADRPVASFSGGMKRRANLIVGMLHRPPILFLDEPTVGVDAQSRRLILESLIVLREAGTTLVYTTHYMEEAHQLCTRVAIMDAGRIIAEGAPDALLAAHPGCANLEAVFLQLTGRQLRDS